MHINAISCGQGSPSLALILVSKYLKKFDSDILIVADTGNENDMLWSNGRRTDAKTFFNEVTKPLSEEFGIDAYFVRSVDKNKNPLPPIMEKQKIENGKIKIDIPLFGSGGGRLYQSCTDKWKKSAIRQQLRRIGAKTATCNLGITREEIHRIKQGNLKWETLAYPLVMDCTPAMTRNDCVKLLDSFSVPYLVSSECDFCPHKNLARWERTSPEVIELASQFESKFNGEFFLSDKRIPIKEAIEKMKSQKPPQTLFDMCDSGYCFT